MKTIILLGVFVDNCHCNISQFKEFQETKIVKSLKPKFQKNYVILGIP